MQTLSIAHVITGLSRGGAENVLYRLIEAQPDPSRHSVISLLDEGVFGERLQALGVEVRCMGLRQGRVPSPYAIWKLSRWLQRLRPDVVQTWMYHADLLGGLAARLAGIPVCWGLRHSNLSPEKNRRLTLLIAQMNARLSQWIPSRIVSCSVRAAEIHRSLGYANKFTVIPNGLDLNRFVPVDRCRRDTIRHELGIPERCKVIGHLGRSDPQKDHATLLKSFAKVAAQRDDTYLLLAGRGLEHGFAYLDELLVQTGAVTFANRVKALGQRDDVADLMAAMDVFVLTSVGEAFPNVVVEAMACGTPCVVTDVGDSAEIVGETGWIALPGDVDGLASMIIDSQTESEGARIFRREQSRRRVEERYGVEQMLVGYQQVWDEVVTCK